MKWNRWLFALTAACVLSACGGGGGSSGTSVFDNSGSSSSGSSSGGTSSGTTTSSVAKVEVLSSSTSVGSGSGNEVTISALVKDSGNVALASEKVTFSVDSGSLVTVTTTTDSTGQATAKFSAGADKSNRTATIKASVAKDSATVVTGQVQVEVTGTKLQVSAPTALGYGESGSVVVKAVDSSGTAIANGSVAVSSSLGGVASSTLTTDSSGQVSLTYTGAKSGVDSLSFSGLGAKSSSTVSVSSEDFAFTTPSASSQLNVGTAHAVTVRYREAGVGVSGRSVSFSSTGGDLSASSATTGSDGSASVSISSTSAGPVLVEARLTSSSGSSVSTSVPLVFVATTPSKLVLQATPTAVGPNSGSSTANQAKVLAKVTDAAGNPVAGKEVLFKKVVDPSGGSLLSASAKTDVNGQATVQYVSGPNSTSSGGVTLSATVNGTSVTGTTNLTVSQSALFISLGTGNTITNVDTENYQKNYTASVTDANGVPVSGVTLTFKVLPVAYRKGRLAFNEGWGATSYDDITDKSTALRADGTLLWGVYKSCPNEDLNYNGVIDSGEDVDSSKSLAPGNVISVSKSSVATDATGRATVALIYAESYVPWVEVALVVQAVVDGTESSTRMEFLVKGASEDFNSADNPPAAVTSPFGVSPSCAVAK